MIKCPDCAEENINESLFCKHCGRCLLAPDPERVQWSTAIHIEDYKTDEGIDFHDGHIVKNSSVARQKGRQQTAPVGIGGWILVLNLLVFILISEIARYIISR
jgi:hypothetical protein